MMSDKNESENGSESVTDPFLGKQVTVCGNEERVSENPADDHSYLIETKIGGILQQVVVSEKFVQNQVGVLFQCQQCGFDDSERDTFDKTGLAMKCPSCGSTKVEQRGDL